MKSYIVRLSIIVFFWMVIQTVSAQTATPNQPVTPTPQAAAPSSNPDSSEVNQQIIDAYKDSVDNLKWALGILIAIFLAAVGFIYIKIDPQNEIAFHGWGAALLEQAKTKTGDKADALVTLAAEKLQKAVKLKPDYHEALCNWGIALAGQAKTQTGSAADALFAQAYEKYQKSVKIKPDEHKTFFNWGTDLLEQARTKTGAEADALLAQATEKFQMAVEINQDYYEAFGNWGTTLLYQAKAQTGDAADALFAQAEEKFLAAEKIKQNFAAYNLACHSALTGNPEQCHQWLQLGVAAGTLPTRETAEKDTDLDSVREAEWFQQIRWKGEK